MSAPQLSPEVAQQRLSKLIPSGDDETIECLTDSDYQKIAFFLTFIGQIEWSKRPRHYVILRVIDERHQLDRFDHIAWGKASDIAIPYSKNNLPTALEPHKRNAFFEKQRLVITKIMELERGLEGNHLALDKPEALPFQRIAPLGSGGWGSVEKVFSVLSFQYYAVKYILRAATFRRDVQELERFTKELANAKKVQHHHVAQIVGSFTLPRSVGIVIGTVGDYDFRRFLDTPNPDPEKRSLLRSFYGCLASGLAAIHDQGIRHNDIKPHNILVKGNTVYFTDFGTSYDHSDRSRSTTNNAAAFFTRRYCSPEVANERPKNSSSDIWSLGLIYMEMATRLHNKTVDDMRTFLDSRDQQASSCYSKDIDGLRFWVEMLRLSHGSDIDEEDKLPLKWILKMIGENMRQRPTAVAIRDMIDGDVENASSCFMCLDCRNDLEPMFSENLTDSSSVMLIDDRIMAGSETLSLNSLSPTYTHRSSSSFSGNGQRSKSIAPEEQETMDVKKYLAHSHAEANAPGVTSQGRPSTGSDQVNTILDHQGKFTGSYSMMARDDDSERLLAHGVGSKTNHSRDCWAEFIDQRTGNAENVRVNEDKTTESNWIASELVRKFGLESFKVPQDAPLLDFHGSFFRPTQFVNINMAAFAKTFHAKFFIAPEGSQIGLVVGQEFINAFGHTHFIFPDAPNDRE